MEVHRARFFQYNPSAIQCLSFQKGSSPLRLALSRENGNVEIWEQDQAWTQTMVLYASKEECAESILWYQDRLLSAGLSGVLIQWNLARQNSEMEVNLCGGAVWDMAVRPNAEQLAVACEDGCVRLFDIEPNTAVYKKSYSNQGGGRCLAVAFHPEGNHMLSGGSDSVIRIWNLTSGVSTHRITLDSPRQQAVLIWTLAFLQDMTVVSGDSDGRVQFWDGNHGAMIQNFAVHKADVLCLVTNEEQDTVFASGVDCKVAKFHAIETAEGHKKWINAGTVRSHTHDVRSLALHDEAGSGVLVSGGLDTQLCVYATSNFSTKNTRLIRSYPRTSPVSICHREQLVACQFDSHVDMWSLGTARGGTDLAEAAEGTVLSTLKQPAHVVRIKSKSRHHIACSAVSPCGNWVAISDRSGTRIFSVTSDSSGSTSSQNMAIKSASRSLDCAQRLAFSADSSKLLLACNHGLQVAAVAKGDVGECRDVYQTQKSNQACVGLTVTQSGHYAALAYADNRVDIVDLRKEKLKRSTPRLPSQCSGMVFVSSSHSSILICTLSYQLFVFNFADGGLEDLSRHLKTISTARRSLGPIMACSELEDGRLMLHSHAFMATLDLTKEPKRIRDTKVRSKKRKSTTDFSESAQEKAVEDAVDEAFETEEQAAQKSLTISSHFVDILGLGLSSQSRLVAVERPWQEISQKLPDTLHRVRYGAS